VTFTGTTAIGHDFDAIANGNSPFVHRYNHVMESIASAPYLIAPKLEKIFPRVKTIKAIDELVASFQTILTYKKENPGNDMLTYMMEDKGAYLLYSENSQLNIYILGRHDGRRVPRQHGCILHRRPCTHFFVFLPDIC
jgi:hypothetical protein